MRTKLAVLVLALTLFSAFQAHPLRAQADGPISRLEFHGYLSQAFAISDGAQVAGITDQGTAEYRTGALQLGYALTDSDKFIIQLSHELLGHSPSNEFREDVELDWLFYRHSFSDTSSVRLGRAPVPIGIYNEIKDVGTLLPFFRPSRTVYGEGTWTSDTIDGVIFSQAFGSDAPWGLSLDLYYGSWKGIESDTSTQSFAKVDADNAYGLQLWLRTPLSGLRFGLGANRADVSGGIFEQDFTDPQQNLYLSLDADFPHVTFRAELYDRKFFLDGEWRAYYTELQVKVNPKLTLLASYDHADLTFTVPFFATFDGTWSEEHAVGMNYKFRSSLVLKAEYHILSSYDIEGRNVDAFFGDPIDVNFGILSLAVHF